MKKYNTSSKVKEKEKIRRETTEYKAIQKKWSLKRSQDPVYKEKKNKYNKRPEVRAKARKLAQTDKYQTKAKEYRLRPEVMAKLPPAPAVVPVLAPLVIATCPPIGPLN